MYHNLVSLLYHVVKFLFCQLSLVQTCLIALSGVCPLPTPKPGNIKIQINITRKVLNSKILQCTQSSD